MVHGPNERVIKQRTALRLGHGYTTLDYRHIAVSIGRVTVGESFASGTRRKLARSRSPRWTNRVGWTYRAVAERYNEASNMGCPSTLSLTSPCDRWRRSGHSVKRGIDFSVSGVALGIPSRLHGHPYCGRRSIIAALVPLRSNHHHHHHHPPSSLDFTMGQMVTLLSDPLRPSGWLG